MAAVTTLSRTRMVFQNIRGILLDIHGVLYDNSADGGVAIPGSAEAIDKIKSAGLPLRFVTNETSQTRDMLVKKLNCLGYNLSPSEIFTPVPAACSYLKEHNLRPWLLVHEDVTPDFAGVDQSDPNCVLIGDAADNFSYHNVNKAFQLLVSMKEPKLLSLGRGKYYKHGAELILDVGAYMKALEYACDVQGVVIGKPAKSFFLTALKDMGVEPSDAIMVGDDLVNDVGGAQSVGMRGIQVRSGKYRPQDESHPDVKADYWADNLLEVTNLLLENRT